MGLLKLFPQANMPCFLWSSQELNLLVFSCTLITVLFLLFPPLTSQCFPPYQSFPLGLLCSMKNKCISILKFFSLSKSCFSCNPLNFMMQDHSPNHSSHLVSCKKPSLCNSYTLELPGGILKSHCPGYTPYKVNHNSQGWELTIRISTVQQSQNEVLSVCKIFQVITICGHRENH